MLEQEIASIMAFVIKAAGNPMPYYDEVPEGFLVPSVYFPVPEILSSGDTLTSYAFEYAWYIKFFHSSTPLAHSLALPVLSAINADRNLIPLIDLDGKPTGKGFRVYDPNIKPIDNATGVIQLHLSWKSPRPYNVASTQKMMAYDLNIHTRGAYQSATKGRRI